MTSGSEFTDSEDESELHHGVVHVVSIPLLPCEQSSQIVALVPCHTHSFRPVTDTIGHFADTRSRKVCQIFSLEFMRVHDVVVKRSILSFYFRNTNSIPYVVENRKLLQENGDLFGMTFSGL